jgi:hypothetical protein
MYERKVAPPILSFTLKAPGNTIKGKDAGIGKRRNERYLGLCRTGRMDLAEGSNLEG